MPQPIINPKMAQNVQDSFNGNTGLLGLKKMFGSGPKEDPMKAALNKRQQSLNEMKDQYGGPAVKY